MTKRLMRAGLLFTVMTLPFSCTPPPPVMCETGDEDVCDAGALPLDVCNSTDEALNDPQCQLALGMQKQGYISKLADGSADKDYYSVTLPAGLNGQSLLHVQGGYTAASTAVNFSVNVLKVGADKKPGMSIANATDKHGAAAPKPIDIIMPFSESNAQLFVLVSDFGQSSQINVDNRNPYGLTVSVQQNPDSNEPNDTTPTAITLTDMAGIKTGTASGYLATNNDVDRYTFNVSGTRQIIYLRILGPTPQINPPPNYRLQYKLLDPAMTPISEGVMDNEFQVVDLSTARLAGATGTYTVVIDGYKMSGSTEPVKGDLRLKYDVEIRVMGDVDTHEPNDVQAMAKPVTLSLGGSQNITGRISYVPDSEWFLVQLPANNQPTTLRYKVLPGSGTGRFPPLTLVPNRQWQILQNVTTGATTQDKQVACTTNAAVCPKGVDAEAAKVTLVNQLCQQPTPQCLWAQRTEQTEFKDLKNFVGAIAVPPHAGQVEYLVGFEDQGLGRFKFADDRDFSIQLSWVSDDDEAARVSGPTQATLGSSTTTSSGALTFGHGRVINNFDINNGDGIRGPDDYDAIVTDTDLYRFSFSGMTGDQTWNLQWEVDTADGGKPPGELAIDVSFCSGPGDGGSCPGPRQTIAYSGGARGTWYAPSTFVNQFQVSMNPNLHSFTLLPITCSCFKAETVAAGSFFVNVQGTNRISNDPLTYRLKQSISTYPGSYNAPDGGASTGCPALPADGGSACNFSSNP